MVPRDAFPPHGYLDNPFHTRNLRPSGVVRSQRGIGFGWHFPALARGYGYREVYRAGLRLYLADEAGVRLELADFPGIVAVRHTKNEVAYAWSADGLELEATWFLVGEHTLACRARLRSDRPRTLTVGAGVNCSTVSREVPAVRFTSSTRSRSALSKAEATPPMLPMPAGGSASE